MASEQEAREVRASLMAGASFEALAAGPRGGYLGRIRLSDLRNDVRTALETVVPGGVTNPIRMENAYVLFQIVPEAESRWIDLDEAGAQALTDGHVAEARVHFEQALAHAEAAALGDARIARSLDTLATLYRLDGRVEEAEKLYRRAVMLLERVGAQDIEIAQVLSGLGLALVKQARFAEAESLYERARSIREKRLGPDHPEVAATFRNIAELFAAQGRFVEAAKLYEQSQELLERKLGSNHQATVAAAQSLEVFRRSLLSELLDRASTAASLSEFRDRESIRRIHELLPLAPLSENGYLQMKDILLEAGLSDETEDVLRTGLKKFPESRILRIYLADLLAGTGRTEDALGLLQETSRLPRPEKVDAATERQQQGIIYQRIGDIQSALTNWDEALAAYRQAIDIDTTLPAGRLKLGRAYFSTGRLDEALTEFQLAIRDTPKDGEAHLSLSEVHLAGGQWERAAAAAERAVQLGVSDSRALYVLGTALVRMGRREQGEERLREFAGVEAGFQAAELRNREITDISVAAARAFREGNGNSAVEQLTRGIARYPDSGRLLMNLAMVRSQLGWAAAAIETLESMLKLGVGRRFLVHKNLADEYAVLGDMEASRHHHKIYLDTRESELIANAH